MWLTCDGHGDALWLFSCGLLLMSYCGLPAVGAKISYFGLPVLGTAKFPILVACQKGLDKQDRPRSDSYYA